ncbi:MAG TPA: SidA/IucD/PvdA family monooxygenase [Jatrophihabitans sp.]|nr:SidA/IucD/PvdA family monooxygenase [Jatrophihabitans sp.]
MTEPDVPYYHAVGIGAGPANLSLAALFQGVTDERLALFDKSPGPAWHASLLHPGVRMQTTWMKDLVSLVDPTHPLSFMNYLVTEGRLFAMLNAQFSVAPRGEYMRYLAWATERIENIHFNTSIDEVTFVEGEGFYAVSDGTTVARSEHLVMGVGTRSIMPAGLSGLPEDRTFVADHLAMHLPAMSADTSAPVAVIGGGQTGIEAVMRLLGAGFTNIRWMGRPQWFRTMDDSPTANEIYRPLHIQYLHNLTRTTRKKLVDEASPTGDALTPGVVQALYQANYDAMLANGSFPVTLMPGRDVIEGALDGDEVVLKANTPEKLEEHRVAYAVVAVGRQLAPVPFSAELAQRIDLDEDGEMIIDEDYSVRWKGMNGHRIYAMNRGRFSHGIQDANLSLLPVRAALVLNSMLGAEKYQIRDEICPVQWS